MRYDNTVYEAIENGYCFAEWDDVNQKRICYPMTKELVEQEIEKALQAGKSTYRFVEQKQWDDAHYLTVNLRTQEVAVHTAWSLRYDHEFETTFRPLFGYSCPD